MSNHFFTVPFDINLLFHFDSNSDAGEDEDGTDYLGSSQLVAHDEVAGQYTDQRQDVSELRGYRRADHIDAFGEEYIGQQATADKTEEETENAGEGKGNYIYLTGIEVEEKNKPGSSEAGPGSCQLGGYILHGSGCHNGVKAPEEYADIGYYIAIAETGIGYNVKIAVGDYRQNAGERHHDAEPAPRAYPFPKKEEGEDGSIDRVGCRYQGGVGYSGVLYTDGLHDRVQNEDDTHCQQYFPRWTRRYDGTLLVIYPGKKGTAQQEVSYTDDSLC